MLLKELIASFFADVKVSGLHAGLRHLARSLRALSVPGAATRTLEVLEQRRGDLELAAHERFFFLQQRHHLAAGLSVRQRIESVAYHYGFEAAHYLPGFRERVYREDGLLLWHTTVDGNDFSIRLQRGNDNRCEGELSAVLFVNGTRLSVTSYSYVDGRVLGLGHEPILFITRSQSGREELQQSLFRAAFKQTTPPYFCLAAVMGIASAHGMVRLAAVRHEAHIACEPENQAHLRNSYDVFWHAFQATAASAQAFVLPVPMAAPPLTTLPAKHRNRAMHRRAAWAHVTGSARAAIAEHQVSLNLAHCIGSAYLLVGSLVSV